MNEKKGFHGTLFVFNTTTGVSGVLRHGNRNHTLFSIAVAKRSS